MSFECDCCGKNGVDQLGKWCSECQEKAFLDLEEVNNRWYESCKLCLICAHADGVDANDYCDHYNMPLWMVKRKNKCKYYVEVLW